jgi:hypothetical protein
MAEQQSQRPQVSAGFVTGLLKRPLSVGTAPSRHDICNMVNNWLDSTVQLGSAVSDNPAANKSQSQPPVSPETEVRAWSNNPAANKSQSQPPASPETEVTFLSPIGLAQSPTSQYSENDKTEKVLQAELAASQNDGSLACSSSTEMGSTFASQAASASQMPQAVPEGVAGEDSTVATNAGGSSSMPNVGESGSLSTPRRNRSGSGETLVPEEVAKLQASVDTLKAQLRERDEQKQKLCGDLMEARRLTWEHKSAAEHARHVLREMVVNAEGETTTLDDVPSVVQGDESSQPAYASPAKRARSVPTSPAELKFEQTELMRKLSERELIEEREAQLQEVCAALAESRAFAGMCWRAAEERLQVVRNLEHRELRRNFLSATARHPAGDVFFGQIVPQNDSKVFHRARARDFDTGVDLTEKEVTTPNDVPVKQSSSEAINAQAESAPSHTTPTVAPSAAGPSGAGPRHSNLTLGTVSEGNEGAMVEDEDFQKAESEDELVLAESDDALDEPKIAEDVEAELQNEDARWHHSSGRAQHARPSSAARHGSAERNRSSMRARFANDDNYQVARREVVNHARWRLASEGLGACINRAQLEIAFNTLKSWALAEQSRVAVRDLRAALDGRVESPNLKPDPEPEIAPDMAKVLNTSATQTDVQPEPQHQLLDIPPLQNEADRTVLQTSPQISSSSARLENLEKSIEELKEIAKADRTVLQASQQNSSSEERLENLEKSMEALKEIAQEQERSKVPAEADKTVLQSSPQVSPKSGHLQNLEKSVEALKVIAQEQEKSKVALEALVQQSTLSAEVSREAACRLETSLSKEAIVEAIPDAVHKAAQEAVVEAIPDALQKALAAVIPPFLGKSFVPATHSQSAAAADNTREMVIPSAHSHDLPPIELRAVTSRSRPKSAAATVGRKLGDADSAGGSPSTPIAADKDGLITISISRDINGMPGFSFNPETLAITQVDDGRPELSSMRKGSIIKTVNGKPVATYAEYTQEAKGVSKFRLGLQEEALPMGLAAVAKDHALFSKSAKNPRREHLAACGVLRMRLALLLEPTEKALKARAMDRFKAHSGECLAVACLKAKIRSFYARQMLLDLRRRSRQRPQSGTGAIPKAKARSRAQSAHGSHRNVHQPDRTRIRPRSSTSGRCENKPSLPPLALDRTQLPESPLAQLAPSPASDLQVFVGGAALHPSHMLWSSMQSQPAPQAVDRFVVERLQATKHSSSAPVLGNIADHRDTCWRAQAQPVRNRCAPAARRGTSSMSKASRRGQKLNRKPVVDKEGAHGEPLLRSSPKLTVAAIEDHRAEQFLHVTKTTAAYDWPSMSAAAHGLLAKSK